MKIVPASVKKRLFPMIALLWMSIASLSVSAQLSGTFSIGTSGTYTSFNEAMTAMVDNGVNGDIIFQVQAGIYQERVLLNFDDVSFSSLDLNISFVGQGSNPQDVLVINQSSGAETDYTMKVDGGQNITFRNIKFQNRGLVFANVVGVGLETSVTGITFDNCHFQGTNVFLDNTFPTSIYFESGTSGITVTNTLHEGSNYGITCWSGTSNILIRDNELYEQHIQAMSLSVSNALIENNYIEKLTDAADQYNYGIELWQGNDFIVRSNRLSLNVAKIAGLALNDDFTINNDFNIIEQNAIIGSTLNNGIRLSGSNNTLIRNNYASLNDVKFGVILTDSDQTHLVHNTFKMNSEGDLLVVVSGEGITSYNNIMINYGAGTVYASLTSFQSDYNFVYTKGEEFSSDDDTFELHQLESTQDQNSQSFLLEFPDSSSPEICHYAISNAGIDLSTISSDGSLASNDIYGTQRNESNPEIGAYEFDLPTTTIFSADTLEICFGTEITIEAENSFESYLWLNDSTSVPSITVDSINTYQLQVTDSRGCVLFDSVHLDVQVVDVDLGEDQAICIGNTITLETPEGMALYNWSTGDTESSIEVTQPGTYSVEITNELGCTAEDELVVSLSEDTFDPNFLVSNIGCTSDTIQFAEVSQFEPDAWLWDFGDGNTSEEQHPSHRYGAVGDYNVTMLATIGDCSLIEEKEIVITSTCSDFLIAYFPLDTGANDISDQEFHGDLMGDLQFINDSERGRVALFDGVDDHIQLTSGSLLDLVNSSFTVSAWIKLNASEGNQPILGNSIVLENQGLNLGVVDAKAELNFFNNGLGGTQSLASDVWNFVTYSYDLESQSMKIYVNGEQDASLEGKNALEGFDLITIGLAQSQFFSGYIDDLRIWRDELSPEEIYENWSGYNTELVAHYDFTGSASDFSNNGFDGTINGNVIFIEDEERGQVVQFGGGSKDFILLNVADSMGITESSFVVSAWVKITDFDKNDLTILGTENTQGARKGLHLLARGRNPHMGFWAQDTRARNTLLNENEWHHLTFLYDQVALTQTIRLNGQIIATGTNKNNYLGTQQLVIGNSINFRKGFNGYISDLKIRKIKDAATAGREELEISPAHSVVEIDMKIYPNPTVDQVHIALANEGEYRGNVILYDLQGVQRLQSSVEGLGELNETLSLTGLEEGIYFIRLSISDQMFTKTLVIKN